MAGKCCKLQLFFFWFQLVIRCLYISKRTHSGNVLICRAQVHIKRKGIQKGFLLVNIWRIPTGIFEKVCISHFFLSKGWPGFQKQQTNAPETQISDCCHLSFLITSLGTLESDLFCPATNKRAEASSVQRNLLFCGGNIWSFADFVSSSI